MKDSQFEKMDRSFFQVMKKTQPIKIPAEVLTGFSASVVEAIRERQVKKIPAREKMTAWSFRVLTPVFAVFLLFFTLHHSLFLGLGQGLPLARPHAAEILDEMATLKAVGAWNDEDEKAVVSGDNASEEAVSA